LKLIEKISQCEEKKSKSDNELISVKETFNTLQNSKTLVEEELVALNEKLLTSEKDIKEQKELFDKSQKNLMELQTSYDALQNETKSVSDSEASLLIVLEELNMKSMESDETKSKLEEELRVLTSSSKDDSAVIAALQNAKAYAEEELLTLKEKVVWCENENDKVTEQLKEARTEMNEHRASLDKQTYEYTSMRESMSTEINELQSQLENLTSSIPTSDENTLQLKYREMLEFNRHELIADAESAMDDLRGKLEVSSQQLSQAEKDRNLDTKEIVTLRETVHKLNGELSKKENLSEKLFLAEKDKHLEKKENAILKSKLTNYEGKFHTHMQKYQAMVNDLSVAKSDYSTASRKIDEFVVLCRKYEEKIEQLNGIKKEVEIAKKNMKSLRDKLHLKTNMYEKVETKYNTSMISLRQEIMELREQIQSYQSRDSSSKLLINDLKNKLSGESDLFSRAQNESNQLKLEHENIISILKEEISVLEQQRNSTKTKESLAKAESEAYSSQKLTKELKAHCKQLERQLDKENRSSNSNASEIRKLQELLQKTKEDMITKDARLKKLESTRLTNAQVKSLKKMKTEGQGHKERADVLGLEVQTLKKRISDLNISSTDSKDGVRQALETKLRKYAIHCQKLEKEKGLIIDSIKSIAENNSFSIENDVAGAVSQICEKLAAVEDECSALSSAEKQAHSYILKIDHLNSEIKELKEKIGHLNNIVLEHKKKLDESNVKVAYLEKENNEVCINFKNLKGETNNSQSEQVKQVRFLEKENLQLISDVKRYKRIAQTTKAEISAIQTENTKTSYSKGCEEDLGSLPGSPRIGIDRHPLRSLSIESKQNINKGNIRKNHNEDNPFEKSLSNGDCSPATKSQQETLPDSPGDCNQS